MSNQDITVLGKGATGEYTVRVDTWDGTNRHWVYYFKKNENGDLEPKSWAISPYNPTSKDFEDQGLDTAVEALRSSEEIQEEVDISNI
ncbi:hypothetical protein [Halomarina ordinaria]|uniref:DUF1508 domain-containing protein n=1 Tax=Halomarina ordinaria TaxID=3033939 RepID=A0ABD5U9X7_9EURY|nr:hypothetical protein [Halomarina sp. PSRA2]